MSFSSVPKYGSGQTPFADFPKSNDDGLKLGIITRVDPLSQKCDVKVVSGNSYRYEVDVAQPFAGPRTFFGGMPEKNSLVLVGYRRTHRKVLEAVILACIPAGNRSGIRFDPWSAQNPSEVAAEDKDLFEEMYGLPTRYKRLVLQAGEYGIMSASGAEVTVTEDVSLLNRSGDALELRDVDRTAVLQAQHQIQATPGLRQTRGPIRRGAFYLPDGVVTNGTLPTEAQGYYGADELARMGPPGFRFATGTKTNPWFNNYSEFPATSYRNGRKVHYVPSVVGGDVDDPDSGADAFVEERLELSHTTDLIAEVLEDVEGFGIDRRTPYIESVLGTLVGNDISSVEGIRQYGTILKPSIFKDFNSAGPGKFTTESVLRSPSEDIESVTRAAALLFRMRPPRATDSTTFAYSVDKQGKFFLQAPGSKVENYSGGAKNVSGEVNLLGALKAHLGASTPDKVSLYLDADGGIKAVIGHDGKGHALDITYRSSVKTTYTTTNPNDDASEPGGFGGIARSATVKGNDRSIITGKSSQQYGTLELVVDGGFKVHTDRFNVNANSGISLNGSELNMLIAGKTQLQHALAVIETIVAGGRTTTVLAGGITTTVAAGAVTTTVAAGAITMTAGAGAVTLTAGLAGSFSAGTAMSLAAGAAMSISAGAAVSVTAGAVMTLTAAGLLQLTAPQIQLGIPATFGIVRGLPALPPGTPSLDYITGLPYLGSALNRSS